MRHLRTDLIGPLFSPEEETSESLSNKADDYAMSL